LLFYLSPQETAAIPAGAYLIELMINTTNSPNPAAWKGEVHSVPVQLALGNEPASLTPAQLESKQTLLTSYHLLREQPQQANVDIDQLLAVQPDSIAGLGFKSYLLQLENQPMQAERLLTVAIEKVYWGFPDAPEEPIDLLDRRNQIREVLANSIVIYDILPRGQSLTLVWNATPGEKYSVETSTDLKSWLPMAIDLVADSSLSVWTTAAGTETRFFRIRK